VAFDIVGGKTASMAAASAGEICDSGAQRNWQRQQRQHQQLAL